MAANIADLVAVAVQHHQRGELAQAEQLCHLILQTDPSHADTHHLLGVLAYQQGRHDQAIASIRQALALNPWSAAYWSNLGVVQAALGQIAEATASYRKAIQIKADFGEAHNNLGNLLRQLGRLDEAVIHGRLALRHRPDMAEASNNLGSVLLRQGKVEEAVECFHNALRRNPSYAEALSNLGTALERQGKLEEAVDCYRRALQIKPDFPDAYNNLGNNLTRQQNLDEAVECLRMALRLNPNHVEAHYSLGIALKQQGKLDEAAKSYQESLRLRPNYPDAWTNLGNVRKAQYRFEEALTCFENALRLDPSLAETHHNRALLWLLFGNWPQGWLEYEWRWRTGVLPPLPFSQPRWDGSPLDGRTILLAAEQGLGDTLQFIRYVPLIRQRGGRVVVRCQPSLRPLLAGSLGKSNVIADGEAMPHFDVFAPLLSVPGILKTVMTSVPADFPYLQAAPDLVKRWRGKLAAIKGCKIGIAWQGNPAVSFDRWRSISLCQFAPLASVPGVQLISLQKGPGTEQLQKVRDQSPVLDFGDSLDNATGAFMDTAAIMKNLDLVITSDTSVPHLAGALGVPVWVALPLVPDWRWLLEREDSPWYPSMRLFRQTGADDWEEVFQRIAEELNALVAKRRS